MNTIVGLKEFRNNVEGYAATVQKSGNPIIVVKRSKPLFQIVSPLQTSDDWDEVVDFTTIKKGGVDIKEILKRL